MMAGRNKQGPQGMGPMTGRGLGSCRSDGTTGNQTAMPGLGRGQGQGLGQGRLNGGGLGRGFGRRFVNNEPRIGTANPIEQTSVASEIADLKSQLSSMKNQLAALLNKTNKGENE